MKSFEIALALKLPGYLIIIVSLAPILTIIGISILWNIFIPYIWAFLLPPFFITMIGISMYGIGVLIERLTLRHIEFKPVPPFGSESAGIKRNLNPDDFMKDVYKKMKKDGFKLKNIELGALDIVFAKKSESNWNWTNMFKNIYFLILKKEYVDQFTVEEFHILCSDYIRSNYKGFFKSSKIVHYPIIVSEKIDEYAIEWVNNIKPKWGSFDLPVIINSISNDIYYSRRINMAHAMIYNQLRMHVEKFFRYVPLAKCPYCNVKSELKLKGNISLAGWIMAITYFIFLGGSLLLLPVALIPLRMKNYSYVCSKCGMELTF